MNFPGEVHCWVPDVPYIKNPAVAYFINNSALRCYDFYQVLEGKVLRFLQKTYRSSFCNALSIKLSKFIVMPLLCLPS